MQYKIVEENCFITNDALRRQHNILKQKTIIIESRYSLDVITLS